MAGVKVRATVGLAAVLMALPILALPILALSGMAHAEGEDPDAPAKPKPAAHKVVKKKKPAAAALAAPAGPVPYTALNPAAGSVPPPPPPPPVMTAPVEAAQAAPPMAPAEPDVPAQRTEITLKCNTVTNDGKKTLTSGSFYIDLFPSQVFPEQQADFKFDQVDPRHDSLVRESYCLDALCDAKVTGSAYYLVNRVTRHGAALRITLNRANGAFYAEAVNPLGLTNPLPSHIGESGFCLPQTNPDVMF